MGLVAKKGEEKEYYFDMNNRLLVLPGGKSIDYKLITGIVPHRKVDVLSDSVHILLKDQVALVIDFDRYLDAVNFAESLTKHINAKNNTTTDNIALINVNNTEYFTVGEDGVTFIGSYEGFYSGVTYIQIWKDKFLYAEFCQHNIVGIYFFAKPEEDD